MNRDDLLAVLRPLAEARPLPAAAFVDPAALALEERAFLGASWLPVAHEDDVPRPGDWVKVPGPREGLVVVRGADLALHALHAVCTHRGALLCDGERGRLGDLRLSCPYHRWSFATDGALLDAPGALDPAPLPAARVETRAGVVFVNLDPSAPPLDAAWEGGPPWLAPARLGPLARVRRTDHEVRANWKVVVGNFQESHHFPSVHPALQARTPWELSTSVVSSEAWLGGTMEIVPPFETVSTSGTLGGRPYLVAPDERRRVRDALVFPLWLTSLQPDYLLTYRLAPLAVDRTLVVAEVQVHPAAARGADLDDVFSFWDATNGEDRAVCELVQRGLASGRATPRYASSEDGVHAFERVVAARFLAALDGGTEDRR